MPICVERPAIAIRSKAIVAAQRLHQTAHDQHGEERDDEKAEEDAELLADHGEDEVGVRIRKHALHDPLARPRARPAAALERLHGGDDLEIVAALGIEEAVDASGDMRKRRNRPRQARRQRQPASPAKIMVLAPARKKSAPQTATKRMVCPRSGSATSSAAVMRRSATASILPGTSGRLLPSAKSQAVMTMKAGFISSEGWIDMPATKSQRREPLISSPMKSTATIMIRQMTRSDQREAAHLARRQERQPNHQHEGERRVEGVAEDEVQAVQPEAFGDRWARREREHAASYQKHDDQRYHRPVDGPPPVGKR